MALNNVSVLAPKSTPTTQQPKEDWTDKLIRGLQIAKGITGVVSDVGTIQGNNLKNAAMADEATGVLTPKEAASAQASGLTPVAAGTPNSMPYKLRTGPNPEDVKDYPLALMPKPKDEKIGTRLMTVTHADGSKTEEIVPDVAGTVKESEKPLKEAKPVDQGALYSRLSDKVENFRGNKAANQSNMNLVSADTALGLANRYKENYNAMPEGDYNLFVQEMSKIASGGTGSEHGQEAIATKTLGSKWNKFLSETEGHPNGAQLGDFIKNNVSYLQDVKSINQDKVDEHIRNSWNSMRRELDPEHQQYFQEDHADFFQREADRAAAKGAKPGSVSLPAKVDSGFRPTVSGGDEDPVVAAAAKANGTDYLTALHVLEARKAKPK